MIDRVIYPVYVAIPEYPYCKVINVGAYPYNIRTVMGYRKQFVAIRDNFSFGTKNDMILDVSLYSPNYYGLMLNSEKLRLYTNFGTSVVGTVYWASMQSRDQSGKIVAKSYDRLLQLEPSQAKQRFKELSRNLLSLPVYEGTVFPKVDFHPSLFNDYLHIKAVLNDSNFSNICRLGYTAFTDFQGDFVNSSARAIATAVGLLKAGLLTPDILYPANFFKIFRVNTLTETCEQHEYWQRSWDNTPTITRDREGNLQWNTGVRHIPSNYSQDAIEYDYKQDYGWVPDFPLSRNWLDITMLLKDKTAMFKPYIDGYSLVYDNSTGKIIYLRVIMNYLGAIDILWDLVPENIRPNFKYFGASRIDSVRMSGFNENIALTREESQENKVYPKITRQNYDCFSKFITYACQYSNKFIFKA